MCVNIGFGNETVHQYAKYLQQSNVKTAMKRLQGLKKTHLEFSFTGYEYTTAHSC
jgi:hypothetical protein